MGTGRGGGGGSISLGIWGWGGEHITRDMGPWGPKNSGDMGIRR